MFTKILLSRVVLVAATAAAGSGATVAGLNHRPVRPVETVQTASTSTVTRPIRANATLARNANVGASTHGSPSGNATFNGNDQGTSGPPTPGLDALFKAITVKTRSVSVVVHPP